MNERFFTLREETPRVARRRRMNIEVVNWQGKRLKTEWDAPDKTIFIADAFPSKFTNLILYPLEADPKGHLKPLSEILKSDALTLRGQLSGRGFMLLKRDPDSAAVAADVRALTEAGYRARMLRDDTFFRVPIPRRVVGAAWSDAGLLFTLTGDAEPLLLPRNEPVVCVFADLDAARASAAVREADARAARPPAVNFSFKSVIDKIRTYTCDIYMPYRWTALRIASDSFNFDLIGSGASRYAAENLALLLDRINAMPVKMLWDDRLPETAVIGMRRQLEAAAASEKLGAKFGDKDNRESAFNFYSRFRYILELASGFKCFG